MSDVRRLRRNRENRRNLFKRKLEDIERQEKEQRLKREQQLDGSQQPTHMDDSTADSTNNNNAGYISTRLENHDKPREKETTDHKINPNNGRLKPPPSWVARAAKPIPPTESRSTTSDVSPMNIRKKNRNQTFSRKWELSSYDHGDCCGGKYDPIRNERRKRPKIIVSSPESNLNFARENSSYEVSQSPTAPVVAAVSRPPKATNARAAAEDQNKLNSDSDSDGSFNMLALFKEKKEQRLKTEEINQQDNQTILTSAVNNTGTRTTKKEEDTDLDDEIANCGGRRKKDNKEKIQYTRNFDADSDRDCKENGRNSGNNHDDDNDDDGSLKNGVRNSKFRHRNYRSNHDEGHESQTDDNDNSDTKRPPTRWWKHYKPRNPITLEREANDRFFLAAMSANTTNKKIVAPSYQDDDDGFMSDCDPVSEPIYEGPKNKTITSRYKKDRLSRGENDCKSRKQRANSEQQQERLSDSNDEEDEDGDDSSNDDYDKAQQRKNITGLLDDLHPVFKNPKFGPYEPMEPLLLSKDQSELIVQVPASLSRYLAPFQKEGVRFMYDCLVRKSGVILGDEMVGFFLYVENVFRCNSSLLRLLSHASSIDCIETKYHIPLSMQGCGKTVQVISLLCGLFNKAGTRKDLEDIRERDSLVRKQKLKVQRLRDQALRIGEVVDENIEGWKQISLSLSPWNPVMIIVPPTIMDTWKNAFNMFSHFSVSFYSGKTKTNAIDSMLYGNTDILLVPKSVFQNEIHFAELEKVQWKLVIIDEFHNFKNHKAKISIHLRKLKILHHPLILGMTGTPMQNNHKELWNLVDLVETNYFGTREDFNVHFDRPITLGR